MGADNPNSESEAPAHPFAPDQSAQRNQLFGSNANAVAPAPQQPAPQQPYVPPGYPQYPAQPVNAQYPQYPQYPAYPQQQQQQASYPGYAPPPPQPQYPQYPPGSFQPYPPQAYPGPYAPQPMVVQVQPGVQLVLVQPRGSNNSASAKEPAPQSIVVVEQRPGVCHTHTVFLGRRYDNDVTPAAVIFAIGWCCFFVWAFGFRFIKSRHPVARGLAIASVVLFFLWLVGIILAISLSIGLSSSRPMSTTSTYVSAQTRFGASVFIPTGAAKFYVSYANGRWQTGPLYQSLDARGSSSFDCTDPSCPVRYDNLMELVARCNTNGTVYAIGAGAMVRNCPAGGRLYLGANDFDFSDNTGGITVTVDFYN